MGFFNKAKEAAQQAQQAFAQQGQQGARRGATSRAPEA